MAVSGGGPVVYAQVYELAGAGSIPGPIFLHFLSLVLMRKLVYYAQTKPAGR